MVLTEKYFRVILNGDGGANFGEKSDVDPAKVCILIAMFRNLCYYEYFKF